MDNNEEIFNAQGQILSSPSQSQPRTILIIFLMVLMFGGSITAGILTTRSAQNSPTAGLLGRQAAPSPTHTASSSAMSIGTFQFDTVKKGLRYFGFYNVDDYFEEIKTLGNTNILSIGWHSGGTTGDPSFMQAYLAQARLANMKVIIRADDVVTNTDRAWLPNTWQERWKRLKQAIAGYEDTVYAFYFDEPFVQNHNSNSAYAPDTFRAITKTMREEEPGIGTMAIEEQTTIPEIPANYHEYITDLGFDMYGVDPTTNPNYAKYYSILESHLPGTQHMWLIPEGYDQQPADIQQRLLEYYSFAKSHPRVIGILTFLYSGGGNICNMHMYFDPANSVCFSQALKDTEIRVGKEIIAGPESTH